MKTLIIGSRTFQDYPFLCQVLEDLSPSSVLSGGALGADSLAAIWAQQNHIPLQITKPDYNRFQRKAPLVRNKELVQKAEQVIAFWNGTSSGTAHALCLAKKARLPCFIFWPSH